MKVELVTKTFGVGNYIGRTLDELVVAQARVSSDRKGENLFKDYEKLIRHLISEQHWSPFDMANLGFEIETSRAISLELIRHSSIKPQQYSQRYSDGVSFEIVELREQAKENRQSSTNPVHSKHLNDMVKNLIEMSEQVYKSLRLANVSKETARFILPEITTTKLYMNGSIRSWITFLNSRLHKTSQKEMRDLANEIKKYFIVECPKISEALFNFENAEEIHILDRIVLEKYGLYKNAIDNAKKM
jgi:thymidylate synthase (FAD)